MLRLFRLILLSILVTTPLLAQTTYTNARYGFSIVPPDDFIALTAPDNGDGQVFVNVYKKARLTVYGSNNLEEHTSGSAMSNQQRDCPGQIIEWEERENEFMLSWVDRGRVSYLKCFVGEGSLNYMLIEYPLAQKKRYAPLLKELEASFTPGDLSQSH